MNFTDNDWSVDVPYLNLFLKHNLLYMKIRFFIFSIIGASAGLPALVWSVGELINHRENGRRISVFIILLLLTDFAEIFLTPYVLLKRLLNELNRCTKYTCTLFSDLWWSFRVCGLLLNQLVALEGILSVRYPLYTAAVFSSACFRIFYILVYLFILIGRSFEIHTLFVYGYFLFPLLVFIVSVITWMISCRVSCSAERHSHTSRKGDRHIWFILIFNLLMLYMYLSLFVPSFYRSNVLLNVLNFSWLLMSERLISDPLLCVLVCRQSLRL